ncbi:MAG: PEP-CTERM sorting domain-containing protein [Candidatus Hydrogenedentes bacterium]|nr:PEP-CTERM sorting domain-containing protein [Candidatus Hydrogenedentota bacterium]
MLIKGIARTVAFAGCAAWSLTAGAVTTDGNWSDWFAWSGGGAPVGAGNNATAGGNNWNGNGPDLFAPGVVYQPVADGTFPGSGGQDYDIEAVMLFFDDNTNRLHFGMVTGFNPAGSFGGGGPHYAGDVFFGLGGGVPSDLAVTVGTENTVANDNGARFAQLFGNTGWTTTDPNVAANVPFATPYRVNEDAGGVLDLTAARGLQVNWGTNVNGSTEHNFLEISFLLDALEVEAVTGDQGGVSLHWTMLCGNDVVDFATEEPLAPLPEPATIALFGMGLVGVVLRKRFVA